MKSEFTKTDIRRLDGGLLLMFQALLEHRNARKAAAQLHLSQSAISHGLSRLRDLLDDPLFIRKPHGFEPTQRALELSPQVEALIRMASNFIGGQDEFDASTSTRVFKISAPEFVASVVGGPLIDRLRREAPEASVWISHMPEQDAFEAVRRGELDLAIGRYETLPPASAGLLKEALYEDSYCVVARRGHPTLKGKISLDQYDHCEHVFANARSEVPSVETEESYSWLRVVAIVPQWLTALSLASTTDSIATCPKRLAERVAKTFRLQVLDAPFEVIHPISVSVVRRANGTDAAVTWLLNQIQASM